MEPPERFLYVGKKEQVKKTEHSTLEGHYVQRTA